MYMVIMMMIICVKIAPLKSACTSFKWTALFLGFVSFFIYNLSF